LGGHNMAILSVIKFDGFSDLKWVIFKYPGQEFNDKSKVIVGPGQIALAVHGGKVENIFESGTYTLSTENYPFLKSLVKSVHGGNVPYTMEIYYVNKTIKMDMLWGTKDPIQLIDPRFNVRVRARARGQFALRITNYQFFFTTLVGTMGGKNLLVFETLSDYFRGMINTKVKTILGEYVISNKVSLLDISVYTEEISKACYDRISPEIDKLGMELINFYIETINVPDEDLVTINTILNKKAEFDIMGDAQYRTARNYDVLEAAANNEGSAGGIASAGIGLGMGLGIAPQIGSMMQNANPNNTPPTKPCPKCNTQIPINVKFCSNCGSPMELKCPNCNTVLATGAKFCPECGTKV
jgi:membrane protease subunit (stomatin/prohibitin family)